MANGSLSAQMIVANYRRAARCILCFNSLHGRMTGQKLPALHQSNGVRVNLADGIPVVFRHTANAMLYVQLVLADDSLATCTQKLVVMQQRSGNGIFDSHHTNGCRVEPCMLKNLFERGTTVELYLLIRKVLMGCNVVE